MTMEEIILRKVNRDLRAEIIDLKEQIEELEQDILVLQHVADVQKTHPEFADIEPEEEIPTIGFLYDHTGTANDIYGGGVLAADTYMSSLDLGVDDFWYH